MLLYYIVAVNLAAAILFVSDKRKASRSKRRVPESRLHLFEFLGGAFLILPLIYLIRHKNRKASYFLYTWAALILWVFLVYLFCVSDNFPKINICGL